MTRYELVQPSELSPAQWERWREIQSADANLENPFFSPEFTQCVAAVRKDVEVALIHNDDRLVGFFPLQRDGRQAHPVCGRLSEYHGVIADASADWSPGDLIRDCGVASWRFDHLPAEQTQFEPFVWGYQSSPYMDLSGGFAAYREAQKKSGSSLSQTERKARKLEREVGPLRFEWHTPEACATQSLVEWKTAQYRRTKRLVIFCRPWVENLFHELQQVQSPTFQAPMAALYAGDKLIAVHQGLASPTALHIWFPSYSIEYENYSPGLILLLKLAECAAERGIRRIDFGPSEARYKECFKSHDARVAQGYVSHSRLATGLRSAWYNTKVQIRSSQWRPILDAPLNASRKLRQWLTFK
jgi:CelD/BcsL family acetyltransferase involved in cellulose biosynthesis